MNENLEIVLASVIEVFGLVGLAWFYLRRRKLDLTPTLQLGMHIFVPALAFAAIMDSKIQASEFAVAAAATLFQIGSGLVIGAVALRLVGWQARRELLLPIAFVNSANLPFPLLLANFGNEGLSRGVLCYTVTNLTIFSIGIVILHGGGRLREALKEPSLWATIAAGVLRLLHVHPPETLMRIPRLAGAAAIPVMLFLFGDALARARLTSTREAVFATVLRYASGAAGLILTLTLLNPEGMLRKVLILYALLPPAVVNVVLTQKAGRDSQAVASTVLLASLAGILILPVVLALIR